MIAAGSWFESGLEFTKFLNEFGKSGRSLPCTRQEKAVCLVVRHFDVSTVAVKSAVSA
jgi:hypothetical protein